MRIPTIIPWGVQSNVWKHPAPKSPLVLTMKHFDMTLYPIYAPAFD
jgi:hypothetical protein